MGTQTQPKLPVIDFTKGNLIQGTNSWISTSNKVRSALEEYGCFVISTDIIPPSLHNTIFDLSQQLYDLPMETKIQNTSDIIGFGYGGNFSSMPLLEYFGIEDGATLEATQSFTNLLWPSGNNSFCENAYKYTKMLSELDHCVMQMVCGSYGVDKYYDPLISSSLYLVRFLKYRGPEKEEVETGLLPHTDKSFLAVLDANEVKGLEIETRDGEWINYEHSPSTFVVIAGEPFMAWSNGRIYSPLHRVAMRSGKELVRYSIGLFSFMRQTIEIPKEFQLVDDDGEDEHPLNFKSFNHFDFLQYAVGEGKKFKCAIKAYCGITTTTTAT